MVSSSSYAPNESNSTILREELWLIGAFLSNFFFGIQTIFSVLAFLAVLRRTIQHNRMRIARLVYIVILFSVTAVSQVLMLSWILNGFILQRNYPGGPDAFLSDEWSVPFNVVSSVFAVLANWMMESLMVWRCHAVWSTGARLWWLGFAIPLPLLIAVFATGSLMLHQVIHNTPTAGCILAYGTCSLALNLIATGFIAGRLLVYRHRIVSHLGRAYGQHYVSITMVVIESAAVYTGFLVIVIVVYWIKSVATILIQQVIVQVQTITSVFIIWQIARGKGWRPTDAEVMSAAVSSLNTRAGSQPQANLIQLEVLPTRRDEVEEGSVGPTENESRTSFHKGGEV